MITAKVKRQKKLPELYLDEDSTGNISNTTALLRPVFHLRFLRKKKKWNRCFDVLERGKTYEKEKC